MNNDTTIATEIIGFHLMYQGMIQKMIKRFNSTDENTRQMQNDLSSIGKKCLGMQ